MAAELPSCFIHYEDAIGSLSNFTKVSFERFIECRRQWLNLDGRQNEVALKTTRTIGVEENSYDNYAQFCFHRKCYSAFTNKTIINRAEIRRKKAEQLQPRDTCTKQEEASSGTIPRKFLGSSSTQSPYGIESKSEHVLPPICIICHKEHSYYNDTVSYTASVYFPKRNYSRFK